MNLVGYTTTALSRNDIIDTPTNKNIVDFSIVELKDYDGNLVTIYDDIKGTNPETQKSCDADGQLTFFAEAGDYILEVNGIPQYITISVNITVVNDVSSQRIWGDRYKGELTADAGVTLTDEFSVLLYGGNYYSYTGSDPFPVIVASGIVPTAPDYKLRNPTDHDSDINRNAVGAHTASAIELLGGNTVQDYINNNIKVEDVNELITLSLDDSFLGSVIKTSAFNLNDQNGWEVTKQSKVGGAEYLVITFDDAVTAGIADTNNYWYYDGTGSIVGKCAFKVGNYVLVLNYKDHVNIDQFGAVPFGDFNSTFAMWGCSKFIEWLGGGSIKASVGEYRFGYQELVLDGGSPWRNDITNDWVFNFVECSKPVVFDGCGATFKAIDGLRYGYYSTVDGSPTYDRNSGVGCNTYKAFINFYICSGGYEIKNVTIDGNMSETINSDGYQQWGSGVRATDSKGIMSNVNSNYNALDGIYVACTAQYADQDYKDKTFFNTTLINCDSLYNGRQGLSNVGLSGLYAENCEFSWTGKGGIAMGPGAGFDSEPNATGRNFLQHFVSCKFRHNVGVGFVADSGNSNSIIMDGCLLVGSTDHALWPQKPNITFNDCIIVGSIVNAYASSDGVATKFNRCLITDSSEYSDDVHLQNGYLILTEGADGVQYNNCDIVATRSIAVRLTGDWVMRDSRIHIKAGTETIANKGFALLLRDGTMQDCTIVQDIEGTPPDDAFFVSTTSVKYLGANEIKYNDAYGTKLRWGSWSSASGKAGMLPSSIDSLYSPNILLTSGSSGLGVGGARQIRMNSSEPTYGDWLVGDLVVNSAPSAGEPFGWRCTTAGAGGSTAVFEPIQL